MKSRNCKRLPIAGAIDAQCRAFIDAEPERISRALLAQLGDEGDQPAEAPAFTEMAVGA